jgi:hypothetical protein
MRCEVLNNRNFLGTTNWVLGKKLKKINMAKLLPKVECFNPNTGRRMSIDSQTYELFTKAIKQTLKGGKAISFSEMVEGVKKYFRVNGIAFKKSVPWYAVTVKNDLQVRNMIEVFNEKGRKLNRLKK